MCRQPDSYRFEAFCLERVLWLNQSSMMVDWVQRKYTDRGHYGIWYGLVREHAQRTEYEVDYKSHLELRATDVGTMAWLSASKSNSVGKPYLGITIEGKSLLNNPCSLFLESQCTCKYRKCKGLYTTCFATNSNERIGIKAKQNVSLYNNKLGLLGLYCVFFTYRA